MEIKSLMDVRHWCSKIGLFPVEIEEKTLPVIISYINELGVNLNSKAVIPFGYDYTCGD
jgi:hypothetical protein